jgi:hypothetical protein
MGPDTAAIGMMGWEGPISMGEKKFGDRARGGAHLKLGGDGR